MRASKRAMRIDADGMRDARQELTGREGAGHAAPGDGEAVVRLMLGGSVRARPDLAALCSIPLTDDSGRIAPARPRGPARETKGAGPSGVRIDARAGAALAPPTRKTMR